MDLPPLTNVYLHDNSRLKANKNMGSPMPWSLPYFANYIHYNIKPLYRYLFISSSDKWYCFIIAVLITSSLCPKLRSRKTELLISSSSPSFFALISLSIIIGSIISSNASLMVSSPFNLFISWPSALKHTSRTESANSLSSFSFKWLVILQEPSPVLFKLKLHCLQQYAMQVK